MKNILIALVFVAILSAISITSPSANHTYFTFTNRTNISLIFSNPDCISAVYQLDSSPNVSTTCTGGIVPDVPLGQHTIWVFVANSTGGISSSSVSFSVADANLPQNSITRSMIDDAATFLNSSFGNPLISGLMLLFIFIMWVFIAGIQGDGKALILAGAFFLALGLFPVWIKTLVFMAIGLLVGLALLRLFR